MDNSNPQQRPLFGGAMQCDLPASYVDVSDLRPVPDNQECWFGGNSSTPPLFVLEILEMNSTFDVKAYFENLVKDDGGNVVSCTFHQMNIGSNTWGNNMAAGLGYYSTGNRLCVYLGLLRLQSKQTDILISLTSPADENSSPNGAVFERVLSSLRINDMNLFG